MKSPMLLLRGLWMDFHRLCPDVKGLQRDLETLESRFENEGYGFLTIALPALGDALRSGLRDRKFACPRGFKSIPRGTIPRFLSGMFSEVFEPFSGELKEDVSDDVIKCLSEVLYLFKKMTMQSSEEEILHKKAVASFLETDDIAAKVFIPDRQYHLISLVSGIVLRSLSSEPLRFDRFKHGPGAVYEGYKMNQKWSALTDSVKNAEFDLDSYGYADFECSLTDLSERVEIRQPEDQNYPRQTEMFADDSIQVSRRTARLVTVEKNSSSRRTITVEPMLNQFIQQGLAILLKSAIDNCKILSNCLDITDQSKNQQLALEGSLHDNWATIDLKSASDLMSIQLVQAVFKRHGLFLDHMMDCRSTHIEVPNTGISKLSKFAGMGNALTFPVQSICFAVVCIAAILDMKGTKPSFRNVERASRLIRIYGDDIIVDTRYARQCVNWLTSVGLKINDRKSYLEGNFKESCGVDAWRGVDVTPIYIGSRPDQPSTDPNVIAGLVATSNQAWLRGLYEFSTVLANEVEERLGIALPLVGQTSGSLGWHTHLDASTPTRWNRVLQAFETRGLTLKPVNRRDTLDGYAALLKFFHVPLLGRGKDHLKKSPIRYKLRMALTWVPTYVGSNPQVQPEGQRRRKFTSSFTHPQSGISLSRPEVLSKPPVLRSE